MWHLNGLLFGKQVAERATSQTSSLTVLCFVVVFPSPGGGAHTRPTSGFKRTHGDARAAAGKSSPPMIKECFQRRGVGPFLLSNDL